MKAKLLTIQRDSMDTYPVIRLRGEWLQTLGFEIGKIVLVQEKDGDIVLSLFADEKENY